MNPADCIAPQSGREDFAEAVAQNDGPPSLRRYRSLGQFLQEFLAPAYARQVTDRQDTVWCPEPWKHPDAVDRLGALWESREDAVRNPDRRAVIDWWNFCADPTMRALLSPTGPFKYCSVRNGHKEMLAPLPLHFGAEDVPPELWLEIGGQPPTDGNPPTHLVQHEKREDHDR